MANQVLAMVARLGVAKEYGNVTYIKGEATPFTISCVPKPFRDICLAPQEVSEVNTRTEMVKGKWKGILLEADLILDQGSLVVKGEVVDSPLDIKAFGDIWGAKIGLCEDKYPKHREAAETMIRQPLLELGVFTPEIVPEEELRLQPVSTSVQRTKTEAGAVLVENQSRRQGGLSL